METDDNRVCAGKGAVQHELDQFLEALSQAQTYEGAWMTAFDFFQRHGFEHLVHVHGHVADGAVNIADTRADWVAEDWNLELKRHATDKNNQVTRHMATQLTPMIIGPDFADRERHGEAFWRFIHETSAPWGVRSAFMLPLRYDINRAWGTFGAMSRMKGSEFTRYFSDKGLMLRMAALYADQVLQAFKAQEKIEAPRLTPREQECLLWLAQGLRNDRIAERMGISDRTVELHVANARRKLKAATREQAVASAIFLGAITP